jgi:uncharacterized protein YdaU (DUF1376 family)
VAEKVDIFMPLFVADYLADTTDLTAEEHGAYMLLLMALWRQDGRLENSPHRLARTAKVPADRWPDVWAAIERFFDVNPQAITQGRLIKELDKARVRKAVATENGVKGAAKRWGGHSEAIARPVADGSQNLNSSTSPSEEKLPPRDPSTTEHGTGPISAGSLMAIWCMARNEEFKGHPMDVRGSGIKPERQWAGCELVNSMPGSRPHVEQSMRRFWQQVKAGTFKGAKNAGESPSLAWGMWLDWFRGYFERATGKIAEIRSARTDRSGRQAAPRAPPISVRREDTEPPSDRPLAFSPGET